MRHIKILVLLYVAIIVIQGVVGIPNDNVAEPVVVVYDPHCVVLKDIMINNVSCTFTSPGFNDQPVIITNNNHSVDVSYDEVVNFIKYDKTDERIYNDSFMCCEFATMVHDHAEQYGIKGHVVIVTYHDEMAGHMINAFNTTDKGLVFFDCTGTTRGNVKMDKEVKLTVNHESLEHSVYNGLRSPGRVVKYFYIV